MKITFLIQDISTQGGTERTTICLAREMAKHGHQVHIVSLFRQSEQLQYAIPDSVPVHFVTDLKYCLQIGYYQRMKYIFKACQSLKSLPLMADSDVIICQKLLASLVCRIGGWAAKSVACEHYRYAMYNALVRSWRNRLYNHFRCLVVLTEQDRQRFATAVKSVLVIPNMVSIEPLPYEGQQSKNIVAVGRLTYQKGFDMLVQAVAGIAEQIEDYRIHIYGEGEDYDALQAQIKACRLEDKIFLLPFTQHIEHVYQQAAFYVMSSRFEGFPMTLLEAAAAGVPIVSFACPEGPEVLLKNGGGILVERENISALGQAILRMIRDESFRRQCHTEILDAAAPYAPERIYRQWIQCLEK